MEFELDKSGFIRQYLYSGRKETIIQDTNQDTNQLRYEKYLRSQIAKHDEITIPKKIRIGDESALGMPWKFYYSYGNVFMDVSSFYVELRRIDLYSVTELVVREDMEVPAYLWSCAAVDLWVNGELAGSIKTPVYKPVKREKVALPLKKGKNQIFIRLETLGVRDTRISFALQLLKKREDIRVSLPDEEGARAYVKAGDILNSAKLIEDKLIFSESLPQGSTVTYDLEIIDFTKQADRYIKEDISGCSEIILKKYASFCVKIMIDGLEIKRNFERIELRTAQYLNTTAQNNREIVFERIGKITSIIREVTDGFALYPMLARYYMGQRTKRDEEELKNTLNQIERRMDCADFMTCALIRFMKNYSVGDEIKHDIKDVMLRFRYWMDEDGQDGMCFWSENHSFMFYQAAYFFGQEYPDEIFLRSQKSGRQMYEKAKVHLKEWLSDVCEYGYDEFNSGVYTPITFAAILNLVDYAEPELAELAEKAADLLVGMFSVHCFKNVIISPQGRVYRDVLYPHRQSLQSLVQLMIPEAPYVYSEWLISLATSRYRLRKELLDRRNQKGAFSYQTSNAVIDFYKTEDYILTSVQSPRRDGRVRVWDNNLKEEERERHIYTKSLNECFHGTMQFEPGVLGYQQHLWYAAVDPELVVFVNHPGGSCEDMPEIRPGYWYGNGIIPALRQEKNVLGIVYVIPDTYPIGFTHLYWNQKKFSDTAVRGAWLFGRKASSYIAIWCSQKMINHDDVLFECEKRAYGSKTAYLCICGSEKENGSFEAFIRQCSERKVQFCEGEASLSCREFCMTFETHSNQTQYVD